MANKKNDSENQFMYLGRWVNKDTFRAFVYNETDQKLANNYKEYKELIESGVWFPEKNNVLSGTLKKKKYVANS